MADGAGSGFTSQTMLSASLIRATAKVADELTTGPAT